MQAFDAENPPFDRLTQGQLEEVRGALDIGYFHPQQVLVQEGRPSDALFIVIKGSVEARTGETTQAVLGAKDSFDARAVVHGAAGENFVAAEETLCYLVPRDLVLRLIRQNAGFAAFFYSEVSRKLDALADVRKVEGVESVLRARVREARYGRAVFIEGSATIEDAGRRMRDNNINALFVTDGEKTGVVTGMNLAKAVILRRSTLQTPVREVCHFDVVSIEADDYIFEALLSMTKFDKRRLAVHANGVPVGFLEDIDILGLFAGNSQLIPGRIDRARSPADLEAAARDIQGQVERLHRQGLKVDVIAEITSDLNRRLFRKLFEMLAPPAVREHGCLLLMGSEGRGEQTVRTDQDNALLLAREIPDRDLCSFREQFTETVAAFGFPPCPGNVMVRNPLWSQPLDSFVRQLRDWIYDFNPEAAMNVAIFCDASPVAGRAGLARKAKEALVAMMQDEPALLARFAHLAETFATPHLGVLTRIMATVGVGVSEVDLKRAGTFPIVQGVRALSIEKGVLAVSTAARIEALAQSRTLEADFARELVSALHVFMEFRLRRQLRALKRGPLQLEALARLGELSTVDRDILRDAMRVVRQFREILRNHYRLSAL